MKRSTFIHKIRLIGNASWILGLFLFVISYSAFSSVQTKQFPSNINMCKSGGYITLANLVVYEQNNNDFDSASANQTYTIAAPSGFQFKSGTGSVVFSKNTDFSLKSLTVTASGVVLTVAIGTILNIDTLTFTGLQIEVTTAGFAGANLNFNYTSGQPLNNGISNLYFAHLNPQNSTTAFSLGSLDTMCVSGGNQSLTGFATPTGGTFSGTGITGNTFNPSTAGTGTFPITYTDPTGCSATASIVVLSAPVLNFSSISGGLLCTGNNTNISLANCGLPRGGMFSGSGVTNPNFNPSIAGPGSTIITYSVTGCGSVTGIIKVNETPEVTFFGLASSYCSNSPDVTLTEFPAGGTFSGSGINGSTFQPSTLSPGSNTSISYNYTDGNGCTGTSTPQSVTIKQAPTITISLSPNQNNFTIKNDSVIIGGTQNNPSSGGLLKVTGNGVSTGSDGVSRFSPSIVGAGVDTITRTITAPNGCVASVSKAVTVSSPNGTTFINGLNNQYCTNQSPVTITVTGYTGSFTGPGVIDTNITDNTAIFDPSLISVANASSTEIIIEFNWFFLDEYFTIAIQPVTIYGIPSITISQNISDSSRTNILSGIYCSNDAPVILSAVFSPIGGSGSFSGPGVSNGKFYPNNAGLGKIFIEYSYTDPNGCQNASSDSVEVNQSPISSLISFTGLQNKYCVTDPISKLIPNSNSISSKSYFSGFGLSSDLTHFDPKIAVTANDSITNTYVIKYTYVASNGCATTIQNSTKVSELPQVSLSSLSSQYCNDNPSVTLSGSPSGNGGVFTISPLSNALNGATFSPLQVIATRDTSFSITYTYTDPTTNCINDTSITTIIHPLPDVHFSNLDSAYCYSANSVPLNGSPVTGIGTFGSYSSPTASIASGIFQPSASDVGQHVITYTYTDQHGCSASITRNTTVYGIPELSPIISPGNKIPPHFHLSSLCENDLIQFSDSLSVVDIKRGATSIIDTAIWVIDIDSITIPFNQSVYKKLAAGSHSISYTLKTDKGCTNMQSKNFTIGSYPKASFTYNKVCNFDNTEFYNTSTINVGLIDTISWNFSDGTNIITKAYNSGNTGILHQFQDTGTYNIILKNTSNFNCTSLDSQKIFILPSVTITSAVPYASDFEQNSGGWVSSGVTDTISTWARGIAQKSIINTTASNNHVWVTNLKGDFKTNEISYMYSPCFNFQDVPRPMIHFDYWSATNMNESGANLQYSIDDSTWNVLGTPNSQGINWYNNTTNISSRPAGVASLNQDGWTGTDSIGFLNARHVLDDIVKNNPSIRFRISFAGGSNLTNGFAFDNMWVGERSRLMLLEHFTNASNSSPLVVQENNYIDTLVTDASNFINDTTRNMVALEYHTSFGGFDPIYNRNIPDAGARALYYGVNDVPESNLDGSYYSGSGLLINKNTIETRTLYDPQFSVLLKPNNFNASTSSVSGSITLVNNTPIKNPVTLYISLAERFVDNLYVNGVPENYQWVHAKFLPDAAGTSFAANWTQGQTSTIPFSWTYPSGYLYNPNMLIIIAFVQDNVTKEIYQTAYKALGSNSITAVFNPLLPSSTISLYPNPANNVTSVVLNGTLNESYTWNVVDELGRVVDQGTLQPNADGFHINTAPYASGFYTLRLNSSSNGVKTEKFVVVH